MDSVNYSLSKFNYQTKTLNEIRSFVGNGVAKLVERAIPQGTNNSNYEKCLEIFKEHYSTNMHKKTKPYPQILELLQTLKKKDIKIAVVSNKYDLAVKDLCEQYFAGLIDLAIGESETCRAKPQTDGIEKVLTILNTKKEETIYIGDSEVDILTAKNAQLKMITVSWGFRDIDYLKQNGANTVINNALELLNYIDFA